MTREMVPAPLGAVVPKRMMQSKVETFTRTRETGPADGGQYYVG